jgi:hypothetical protein
MSNVLISDQHFQLRKELAAVRLQIVRAPPPPADMNKRYTLYSSRGSFRKRVIKDGDIENEFDQSAFI